MPRVHLQISGSPYTNVDSVALPDSLSAEVYDGYISDTGATEKRPALESWVDLGSNVSIDGLYWWDDKDQLLAVSAGSTWRITDSAGTKSDVSGTAILCRNRTVAGDVGPRVSFAAAGDYVAAANTEKVILIPVTGSATYVSDTDCPIRVTAVGFVDGYTLATELGTGKMFFSDPDAPDTWQATNFITAEAKSDVTMTMGIAFGEIMLLGQRSAETWYDDGSTPFTRIDGTGVEMGTRSPYTLCFANNSWYFLNANRQLVQIQGRSPKVISVPFQKEFDAFTDVHNATIDRIDASGRHWLILNFPEHNSTYVYDYALNQWQGRWSWFDASVNTRFWWRGTAATWCPAWGFWVVGDRKNGKIYKLTNTLYQDNATWPVKTSRITGHITHGTMARKRSNELIIRVKRGVGTVSVTNPMMTVRWLDDNGAWGPYVNVALGNYGDNEMFARLYRLGIYRSRQYEFAHSDNTPFVLVDVEEDVEVLVS